MNCRAGYIGDRRQGTHAGRPGRAALSDFICGANDDGFPLHRRGISDATCIWTKRTCTDIRNVVRATQVRDGAGRLELCAHRSPAYCPVAHQVCRGSQSHYLDAQGKAQIIEMGCYGIGVSPSWPPPSSRITTSAASILPRRWHRSRLPSCRSHGQERVGARSAEQLYIRLVEIGC